MTHRRKLVILACDRDFLLPTMLCCWQLRQQDPCDELIDIALLHTALDAPESDVLWRCAASLGVKTYVSEHARTDFVTFNRTHVPMSTLLRLNTSMMTEGYEQVLYIDGDVQLVGTITDLLSFHVPEGSVLAAPDRFLLNEPTLGWRAAQRKEDIKYLHNLGLDKAADYFNAGVMAAHAKTWRELCRKASEYFLRRSQTCLYHDQSAFNAVADGRLVRLSPAFNYHTAFREIGAGLLRPKILHFTGAEKPWHSAACAQASGYDLLLARFAKLQPVFFDVFKNSDRNTAIRVTTVASGLKQRCYDAYTHYVRRRSLASYLRRYGFSDGVFARERA